MMVELLTVVQRMDGKDELCLQNLHIWLMCKCLSLWKENTRKMELNI